MINRFHSAKLPWSHDYPLANHIATNKSSAKCAMPLFSRLCPSFGYLRKIFLPGGLKYSLFITNSWHCSQAKRSLICNTCKWNCLLLDIPPSPTPAPTPRTRNNIAPYLGKDATKTVPARLLFRQLQLPVLSNSCQAQLYLCHLKTASRGGPLVIGYLNCANDCHANNCVDNFNWYKLSTIWGITDTMCQGSLQWLPSA